MASSGPVTPLMYDFEDFFNHSLVGYVITSKDGKVIRVNAVMEDWLGRDGASLETKDIAQVFTVGGRIYYETHLSPLLKMQGHFDEVALELKAAGGDKVQVLVNAFERKQGDGQVAFIRYSFFRATDRRRFEQNLFESKLSAETSLEKERELSQLRELFIGVLGHDLKNPLGSITAGAELLSAVSADDKTRKIARIVLNGATRMNVLINDVLDLARGRLGTGMTVDLRPVSLLTLFTQIVEEFRLAWPGTNIDLNVEHVGTIMCDGSRIGQLFSNLLVNAIKHGSDASPVFVRAERQDTMMELSIRNEGLPIPADLIDKLFEPFTRNPGSAASGGMGLGLYIASEIAQAHNGIIGVESTSAFTQFTFTMPVGDLPPE
ncbi:MAG: PAS domain-containing sensor histidine kinase [Chitinophagaceae bacterium]|nr:MAG: PAS domain-containing sensor histidine kinase [Chitinophagaceae bacterium]